MNQVEKLLCRSVVQAFERYEGITGYWLLHAPEHFLQNFLMLELGKSRGVYMEATRRKIADGVGRPPKGRPPHSPTTRYDLVLWDKTRNTLRAVIEIKRSLSLSAPLKKDAKRIRTAVAHRQAVAHGQKAKAGYLIVYSEATVKQHANKGLTEKLEGWSTALNLKLIHAAVFDTDDEDYVAGFAIMRA